MTNSTSTTAVPPAAVRSGAGGRPTAGAHSRLSSRAASRSIRSSAWFNSRSRRRMRSSARPRASAPQRGVAPFLGLLELIRYFTLTAPAAPAIDLRRIVEPVQGAGERLRLRPRGVRLVEEQFLVHHFVQVAGGHREVAERRQQITRTACAATPDAASAGRSTSESSKARRSRSGGPRVRSRG